MVKKNKIIEWFFISLFVTFFIIFILQLIFKITGHSPTETQLLYIGFGGILSYLFITTYYFATFKGRVEEFMSTSKNSFRFMREDIKRFEQKQDNIAKDLIIIKERLDFKQ
tara:strand:- start:1443 stop:1775 length:333 start_codon:yes stop_codon:yes gene_type:complete